MKKPAHSKKKKTVAPKIKPNLKLLRKEVWTLEGFLLASSYLLATIILILGMIIMPLWIAVLLLVFEIAQLVYFKGCFLTKIANKRGYMLGMTFWEYIPYVLGIDDYKRANSYINFAIRMIILVTFVYRFGILFI